MTMIHAGTDELLRALWTLVEGDPSALERAAIRDAEPVLPSIFAVDKVAAATVASTALAAAEVHRLRNGESQTVAVDTRAASLSFRSERYLMVDGKELPSPWGPLAGYYPTGDGGWIHLHMNFPHHEQGVVDLLQVEKTREAMGEAILKWRGLELENALAAKGLCATLLRREADWRAHPQGRALDSLPLLEVTRMGEAAPRALPPGERPLSGVRVLDLTRVIAGPVCGRTLAEHGADVLTISGAHLPNLPDLMIDTSRGKRSACLDLRTDADCERLRELIREADVLVQGYRPGALDGRGFSPQIVAAVNPDIVYVTLCAYGHEGPWQPRRGFDSLVQTASGIAHAGGQALGIDGPKPLPCQALDHATGYLLALGAMTALQRRAEVGGSYLVRASLAQTGRWIQNMERVDQMNSPDPALDDVTDRLETKDTPYGRITALAPVAELSATPPYWATGSVPVGADEPTW